MEQHKMIIGGEAVAAVSANWETVIDPATEEAIAEVPQADYADVNKAVEAAKQAFPSWSSLSPGERSALLYKLANALEAKADRRKLRDRPPGLSSGRFSCPSPSRRNTPSPVFCSIPSWANYSRRRVRAAPISDSLAMLRGFGHNL